jgi:hypothetical protein
MHEKCEAALAFGQDLAHGLKVPSCVEPPAP